MFTCGTCGKIFRVGRMARDQHCDATGHEPPEFECDECDEFFDDEEERWEHMESFNHFFYECRKCRDTWPSQEDCTQHEIDECWLCVDCDRFFENQNALKMHLNSETHRDPSIECPFCDGIFVTATGVLHHLERGSCGKPSGFLLEDLCEALQSENLIGNVGSLLHQATANAFNARTGLFDCHLCPRALGSLKGLTSHLNSPKHDRRVYYCPNTECDKEFTMMAGVISHLESETCDFWQFEDVQDRVEMVMCTL